MLWRPRSNRIEKYKNIRETSRALNNEIIKVIPKAVIDRTAKDMRLLFKGVLVLDSEDEIGFLFDRIIYDVPWDGRSALEHFETESDYQLSEMENEIFQAMKNAYFSLFEVVGSVPDECVQLADLLSDNQIELTDLSMSISARKGLLLAIRILEIQDIIMSTGSGYPFQADQKDVLISGVKPRQSARRSQRRRSARSKDFSDPKNYSLYFFRQYRRSSTVKMITSEEF